MAISKSNKKSTKQYSIADARDQLAGIVHEAEEGTMIELTRRNEPVAAIVSMQEYRKLQSDAIQFWNKLQEFRNKLRKDEYLQPDDLKTIRDKSAGRKVEL
jgi:prevent-host-death family protein